MHIVRPESSKDGRQAEETHGEQLGRLQRKIAERESTIRSLDRKVFYLQERILELTAINPALRQFGFNSAKAVPCPIINEAALASEHAREIPESRGPGSAPQVFCQEERPRETSDSEVRAEEFELIPEHFIKRLHPAGERRRAAFRSGRASQILFSNKTVAHFMVRKYFGKVSFSDMERQIASAGIIVPSGQLSALAEDIERELEPLYRLMQKDLRLSPVILSRGAMVRTLDEFGEVTESNTAVWAMRGYSEARPVCVVSFENSDARNDPRALFGDFGGEFLQTEDLRILGNSDEFCPMERVGCFGHIRKRLARAADFTRKKGVAKEAIELISRLYRIERDLRAKLSSGLIDEALFMIRRRYLAEIVFLDIKEWSYKNRKSSLPRSPLGRAIRYANEAIPFAMRYIEHPLLTPDANAAALPLRPFAGGGPQGRWSLSGTLPAHPVGLSTYSLAETCRANGHDVVNYLGYVLDRLPSCVTEHDRVSLLPYRVSPERVAGRE